jgi:hypothetical protein
VVLEDMDLPRLQSMNEYHKYNPPLHIMVKAFTKMGKQRPRRVNQLDDQAVTEIAKVSDGMTAPSRLAIYRGGRLPKIGDPLWPTTQ